MAKAENDPAHLTLGVVDPECLTLSGQRARPLTCSPAMAPLPLRTCARRCTGRRSTHTATSLPPALSMLAAGPLPAVALPISRLLPTPRSRLAPDATHLQSSKRECVSSMLWHPRRQWASRIVRARVPLHVAERPPSLPILSDRKGSPTAHPSAAQGVVALHTCGGHISNMGMAALRARPEYTVQCDP